MRSRLLWCSAVVVAALGFLVWETRRLAELAGRFEADARVARRAAADAEDRVAAESTGRTAAAAEAARLAGELATANAQLLGITTVLEARTAEMRRASEAAALARSRSLEPMGDGVRECLATLHDCLRAEGFGNQRFVAARKLDAEGLHDVEMFESDPDGLGVTFYEAQRMTAEIDRGRGRLQLRFFDGKRIVRGEAQDLPKDGWAIVFAPIDASMFEQRLPFLVQCEGTYPEPAAGGRRSTDVDPMTRRQWLERFDQLLAGAGTSNALRVTRFRGMADGCFLEAELVGTDAQHRVVSSAHVARLAVEIDPKAGVVSLWLRDGVLQNGGLESSISGEGYRMVLPKLDARKASDILLGMVVTR